MVPINHAFAHRKCTNRNTIFFNKLKVSFSGCWKIIHKKQGGFELQYNIWIYLHSGLFNWADWYIFQIVNIFLLTFFSIYCDAVKFYLTCQWIRRRVYKCWPLFCQNDSRNNNSFLTYQWRTRLLALYFNLKTIGTENLGLLPVLLQFR